MVKSGPTASLNLRAALNGEELSTPVCTPDETPAYLSWLRGRLHGSADLEMSWLEGQTFEQVLAASEMIGGILQHGHKVALTRLQPDQTEEATDIGFSIYSEGPEAVEEALDTIRQTSPTTAVQAGPLAIYGKLFDWLDRRCNAIDPGSIRDILRDHIVKHSAVEPGTKVLGVEIAERQYHSLYSLSETVGIERKRLARILKKLGKVPEHASEIDAGNMVFRAAETTELVETFQTAIPMHDVPEYLGATKHQFEALYREGVVRPVIPRTGRGAVRQVVFGRLHLDEILGKIARLPKLGAVGDDKLHPISYVAQRGAGRFEVLFAEILDGNISAFVHPEKSGIGAIYLDAGSAVTMNRSA